MCSFRHSVLPVVPCVKQVGLGQASPWQSDHVLDSSYLHRSFHGRFMKRGGLYPGSQHCWALWDIKMSPVYVKTDTELPPSIFCIVKALKESHSHRLSLSVSSFMRDLSVQNVFITEEISSSAWEEIKSFLPSG